MARLERLTPSPLQFESVPTMPNFTFTQDELTRMERRREEVRAAAEHICMEARSAGRELSERRRSPPDRAGEG